MIANIEAPAVVLDAAECARLDRQLRETLRLAYLSRHLHPPVALIGLADAVHRAAEQFRAPLPVRAGSGTGDRCVSPQYGSWPVAGQTDLSVAQAAAITGVSESYITRQLRGGILAGSRSGPRGSWLVDAASLAAWTAPGNEPK